VEILQKTGEENGREIGLNLDIYALLIYNINKRYEYLIENVYNLFVSCFVNN